MIMPKGTPDSLLCILWAAGLRGMGREYTARGVSARPSRAATSDRVRRRLTGSGSGFGE